RDLTPREEERLQEMHLWVKANAIEKADWSAYFELWVKKPDRGGSNNGNEAKSATAALRRLGERTGGNGSEYIPGSSGPRPLRLDIENGGESPKLLPKR